MARSPTTLDAFSAIAEPRRRRILGVLAGTDGYRDVTWLVEQLGWPQPQVSKHLGVLRQVGLVNVVREGKHRQYALAGAALKPVFDWAKSFERYWEHQLHRIKDRAERMQRRSKPKDGPQST
jgi:DNA-binding transcriptional ArsR family regulator